MAAYTELPIVDPDQLGYTVDVSFATSTEEIVINTTAKTIALKVTGNLTTDGATIKSVYSKLKDAWRVNTTLIKFPFAMGPITDEQFELINGWNWDKVETSGAATQTTPELLRTGGWSVVNTSSAVTEQWTSVITLGDLGDTDQVYYQQVSASTASVNFKLTGKVNQSVQIYSDPNGDGNVADGYSRLTYFKIFVREWEKLYAQSEILDIGVAALTYQAYRYPLTNGADLKIAVTAANLATQLDANSDGTPDVGVYTNVGITYLRQPSTGNLFNVRGNFASATVYALGDVVKDTGNNRWYKNILAYTSTATLPSANSTNWSAYTEGERQIGANYYAFTVIVDGDTTVATTASGAARTNQIYTAVQYKLRQSVDIDNATGTGATVTGKTASALLRFVGDTLVTSTGVYVDSFNTQDTNAITFTDALGAPLTFPFVAALTVNFGTNLQNDEFSKYWIFFTSAGTNLFGSTNAIIVQDKDGVDMAGTVNPAWPTKRTSTSHSFNYDSNTQGGRTAAVDAAITAVGIGLTTGQYVIATGNIERSTANSVTLTASLERNYAQGTTYP
jgi:hypothetical protein